MHQNGSIVHQKAAKMHQKCIKKCTEKASVVHDALNQASITFIKVHREGIRGA